MNYTCPRATLFVWLTLALALPRPIAAADVAVPPTGSVEGRVFSPSMGPFINTFSAGNSRFDTFEVNAVPEPSTFALLGLGLGTAGFLARRRRQH